MSQASVRVRAKGRQAIPRFAPGALLNQCRLHKTKKHTHTHMVWLLYPDSDYAERPHVVLSWRAAPRISVTGTRLGDSRETRVFPMLTGAPNNARGMSSE